MNFYSIYVSGLISGFDMETLLFQDSVQTTAYYERKIRRMHQINFQTLRLVYIFQILVSELDIGGFYTGGNNPGKLIFPNSAQPA
jgi:hypothetical protein